MTDLPDGEKVYFWQDEATGAAADAPCDVGGCSTDVDAKGALKRMPMVNADGVVTAWSVK